MYYFFFTRQSRFLRAATLSKCLRRNFWGSDFFYDGKPKSKENPQQIFKNSPDEGKYIYAIEKGKITPSISEIQN
ncbi:hypothetical protein PFLG_02623 [Plasmodium falciparum RAJ116]|uniref:Uncharacterized protein n=1 Tax=Plasmodium falciparum RAJ116 TaxID=580058 RepID=A0A0L0CZX0_PLAFA|nr:hypothetical protein PFLG_02623 [Plasmodium falciparum RAJ116]